MDRLYGISLLGTEASWLAWTGVVAGLAAVLASGAVAGGAGPRFRWWAVRVPTAAVGAIALTVAGKWLVEDVVQPFPDHLLVSTYAWIAAGLAGVLLAAIRFRRGRPTWRRVGLGAVVTLAAASVVAGSAAQVNMQYGAFADVGSLAGVHRYRTVAFADVPPPGGTHAPVTAPSRWTPSVDMPATGAMTIAPIPGTVSGFRARPARIYLPPAYFASSRASLPVLVLMSGQPGGPSDWPDKARLPETMDAYAARHEGLAPIVVVADQLGSDFADTLCVDSPAGDAQTYMTVDVPVWIRAHLQAAEGPRTMAIGGLSMGGTCALQLALAAPSTYPVFLDMSGQAAPGLSTHAETVDRLFGGDEHRFDEHDPAWLLAHRRFDGMAGAFVAGTLDPDARRGLGALQGQARAAGIDVHMTIIPGGHSFTVWSAGLREELPWLAQQIGLDG